MLSFTCNSILLMSCLYIVSPPLVKEMGSCDYRGSWSSGHGLIFKGLRNWGFRFNSYYKKRLKNNFKLTECSLTHFLFKRKRVVVGFMSNLSIKRNYSLGVVVTYSVTTLCVLSINSRLQLWKHNVLYPYSFMLFLFLPTIRDRPRWGPEPPWVHFFFLVITFFIFVIRPPSKTLGPLFHNKPN